MENYLKSRTVLLSFSLFVIVFYAPLTISAFLSKPLGYKFHELTAVIFILMAISTFLSTFYIKVSFVLAPGVGIATLLANAYDRGNTLFVVVTATIIASSISFLVSKIKKREISYRQNFLNNLPPEIVTGIRVGIGALLASIALDQIDNSLIKNFLISQRYMIKDSFACLTPIFIFIISTMILLYCDIKSEILSQKYGINTKTNLHIIALRSSKILSPFAIISILIATNSITLPIEFNFSNLSSNIVGIISNFPIIKWPKFAEMSLVNTVALICVFSSIICFVFIIDIPGSPYDMLKQIYGEKHKKIYDQSFLATSVSSIICSTFGLSTSVYYAENNIITQAFDHDKAKERSETYLKKPTIAYICSLMFILTGVLLLFCRVPSSGNLPEIVKFAVAPNLFCLGLHLTSKSLTPEKKSLNSIHSVPNFILILPEKKASMISIIYSPASIIILLIGFIGFEYSVLIGIIYYCAIKKDLMNLYFWGALASLLILFFANVESNQYEYNCKNSNKISVIYESFDENKIITNITINFNNLSLNNLKRKTHDHYEEYSNIHYSWIIENKKDYQKSDDKIGHLKFDGKIIAEECKCLKKNN